MLPAPDKPGFTPKLLWIPEKSLYDEALSSFLSLEHFVWLAWSVKESVYKFLQRNEPKLVFSPSHVVIPQLTSSFAQLKYIFNGWEESLGFDDCLAHSGSVRTVDRSFFFRSIFTRDFIFPLQMTGMTFHPFTGVLKKLNPPIRTNSQPRYGNLSEEK